MSDIYLTIAAGLALAFFSFSVWASVEKMHLPETATGSENSILMAPKATHLAPDDMRARIPAQLLNQLEPVKSNAKGEA